LQFTKKGLNEGAMGLDKYQKIGKKYLLMTIIERKQIKATTSRIRIIVFIFL